MAAVSRASATSPSGWCWAASSGWWRALVLSSFTWRSNGPPISSSARWLATRHHLRWARARPTLTPIARPWLLPLVTGAGALIAGIIVFNLAPEAEGHGTDSAIDAIHHKGARLRARVPPIKLIASAITIGSGGSGGREGPAAQISAGFGSLLAQWLRLDVQDRRIAVAAGMGAGIGAIFRAPLGGAVMAAEILYIHDLEVEALIPGLIASIVGYQRVRRFLRLFSHLRLAAAAGVQPASATCSISRCLASSAGWWASCMRALSMASPPSSTG